MEQQFFSSTLGILTALFPIANPIGAVPIFYSMTVSDSKAYRHRQAQQTTMNVVLVLVAFLLAGRLILSFFGISLGVLQIAGGLIVAHTAWEMVTARQRLTESEHQEAMDKEDISFTPMAVPIISGPGAIGVVISLSERVSGWMSYLGCVVGIVLFGMVLYLCLTLGEPLIRIMGKNGIGAMNRILGFFILGIAVELMANGTIAFIRQAAPELLK
jgi:multiple antibiotic resistance protein